MNANDFEAIAQAYVYRAHLTAREAAELYAQWANGPGAKLHGAWSQFDDLPLPAITVDDL